VKLSIDKDSAVLCLNDHDVVEQVGLGSGGEALSTQKSSGAEELLKG